MKNAWYIPLYPLDLNYRFWQPSQFPRIFRDILAVFPQATFTFYHAPHLPWTILGSPTTLGIIILGNTWDSSINYFEVALDSEWDLHVWASPRGKAGFRVRHHIATEKPLSPAIWEPGNHHFPLFKELLVRLHLGQRKDLSRMFNKQFWSLRNLVPFFLLFALNELVRWFAIEMLGLVHVYQLYTIVSLSILFLLSGFLIYRAIKKNEVAYFSTPDPQEWREFIDRNQV